MSLSTFPIYNYPTGGVTDPNVVLRSMGSFWNQLFNEKGTIRGYTYAQAVEMIQRYLELVQVIYSYSVKDIPVHNHVMWYPLIIKKSEYNVAPLLFRTRTAAVDPDEAVFGPQPEGYYKDVVFKFGNTKVPIASIYSFTPLSGFSGSSIIANGIINPSTVFISDVDYHFTGDTLFFNQDLFSNTNISKVNLIGDNGLPETFKGQDGVTIEDQMMVLWVYNARVDELALFNNFGILFDLKLDSSRDYRLMLQKSINLFVEGPTVNAIKSVAAAFLGITPIISAVETVEYIFTGNGYTHVITDKNCYKYDSYYTVRSDIGSGSVVYAGDVIVDAVEYFDYVKSKDWWTTKLAPKSAYDGDTLICYPDMAFPSHMFWGNYKESLVFKNEQELVTMDADGYINFPVYGTATDVLAFNEFLNADVRREAIATALGLTVSSQVVLNPLDFIFQNFLKHGSALIKFNFKTTSQVALFSSFFKILSDIFPKHVYIMFYFDLTLSGDTYLSNGDPADTTNPYGNDSGKSGTVLLYDTVGDYTRDLTDPDVETKFVIGKYIVPLTSDDILSETMIANDMTPGSTRVVDGQPMSYTGGLSTAQVVNLRLLDFSQFGSIPTTTTTTTTTSI